MRKVVLAGRAGHLAGVPLGHVPRGQRRRTIDPASGLGSRPIRAMVAYRWRVCRRLTSIGAATHSKYRELMQRVRRF